MARIHFSIDDTIRCFKYLTGRKPHAESIFESRIFDIARRLHKTHGIDVTFYCMYTDGTFLLNQVPDCWRNQFLDNSQWLHFGFHCYSSSSDYTVCNKGLMKRDYDMFKCEIKRITGTESSITDTIRLHGFAANEESIEALSELGIKRMLCADDNRRSYCLNDDEISIMKRKGLYYSDKYDMEFVPTDIRIENVKEVESEIIKYKDNRQVTIFTHERFLDNQYMVDRINMIIEGLNGRDRE